MSAKQHHRLIVLGSGPAGLTAAIYAARAGLKPIVIEGKKPGGQLMGTTYVENWPGTRSILGPKLMEDMRKHAQDFNTEFIMAEATAIDLKNRPFTITLSNDKILTCEALIIATGATPNRLKCPGEDEYWGKGVTTCAVCDGAFYAEKRAVIVGGGDTAMENASFMTRFTDKITVIQRGDKLTASQAMQQRVLNNKNIEIIYNSTVTEIAGNGKQVTGVTITDVNSKKTREIEADVVFLAIGLSPNSKIVEGQLERTKSGHIQVTNEIITSIKGVFAAGDVADAKYRQAIVSAGAGCMAALEAERFLSSDSE